MRKVTYHTNDPQGEARLKELILYVSMQCSNDPAFGATKLNKILWKADFMAFAHHGTPITGVEYMRLPNGPVPRRLKPLQEELIQEKRAVVTELPAQWSYKRKVTVPLVQPNLNLFTPEQISLVDEVITAYLPLTASAVSELSHGKAWEIIPNRGRIPYEAAFLSDSVTKAAGIRAREICIEQRLS